MRHSSPLRVRNDQKGTSRSVSILTALKTAEAHSEPFEHYILKDCLPEGACEAIAATDVGHTGVFDGTRAGNNQARLFIGRDNLKDYPFLRSTVEELRSPEAVALLRERYGVDVAGHYLRVEICCDLDGFWLEPHCDIVEKMVTIQVYVDPQGRQPGLGTDFYTPELERVKSVPFVNNQAYCFFPKPGKDSWHGFEKRPIEGRRMTVLINYVTFPTDWTVPAED